MFFAKQPRVQSVSWVFADKGTRKFIAVCELPNNMRVNACMVPDNQGSSLLSKTMPNAFRRPAVLCANFRAFPLQITRTFRSALLGNCAYTCLAPPSFCKRLDWQPTLLHDVPRMPVHLLMADLALCCSTVLVDETTCVGQCLLGFHCFQPWTGRFVFGKEFGH